MSVAFSGSGPGRQAPDGCSVELYRELPYCGELEDVRALLSPGASVLELGCGTGRLTRMLLAWGLRVTCVDNSPPMLAALPEAATRVLSDIQSVYLEERFDIALLASCLINHPVPTVRSAFLTSAHRHFRTGGRLLLERHDPLWLECVQPGPAGKLGPIALCVEAVSRKLDATKMTLRYESERDVWRHSFVVVGLTESAIEELLRQSGFGLFAWFGRRKRWVSAVAQ